MTTFSVWAPAAGTVDLHLEEPGVDSAGTEPAPATTMPLTGSDAGWWSVEVAEAGAGTRYRFSLDGGPLRPDPRSAWQPNGIEGPSAVVDHGTFEWHDGGWTGARLASAVIYEMHVGTFSDAGTFDGAIDHLDHLCGLGVTAIELMPVAEFSGEWGWGYDGVLLWAPHHAYGGPDGLKRLVDAAHLRGLAVILDVVYNHLGPSGNHLAEFGPYFTDRYSTPWGSAVNVDGARSDDVRAFIIGNASYWLEQYHIDGLRLDAVHAIIDESALHVLEELAVAIDGLADHLGRPLWLIAESDRNDPRLVTSREAGGFGLAASWSDDFHHALHAVLTGEHSGYYEDYGPLRLVARCYQHVYVFGRNYSPFRHRHHGRPVGDLPATRFLGYLQNHDQIGNRAVGERSAALMSPGRLKAGAALVLLAPFVPMLFQGEEWGASTPFLYFTNHQDPELGRAVSEGRRKEFSAFGWAPENVPDPQDPTTRQRSVLDWTDMADPVHDAILSWHRKLLGFRRDYPELTDGCLEDVQVDVDEAAGCIVIRRGRVVLACNLGSVAHDLPLPTPSLSTNLVLLASDSTVHLVASPAPRLHLPPDGTAVLEVGPSSR